MDKLQKLLLIMYYSLIPSRNFYWLKLIIYNNLYFKYLMM